MKMRNMYGKMQFAIQLRNTNFFTQDLLKWKITVKSRLRCFDQVENQREKTKKKKSERHVVWVKQSATTRLPLPPFVYANSISTVYFANSPLAGFSWKQIACKSAQYVFAKLVIGSHHAICTHIPVHNVRNVYLIRDGLPWAQRRNKSG